MDSQLDLFIENPDPIEKLKELKMQIHKDRCRWFKIFTEANKRLDYVESQAEDVIKEQLTGRKSSF